MSQEALGGLSVSADLLCESWNEVGQEGCSKSLLVSVAQVVSQDNTEKLLVFSSIL